MTEEAKSKQNGVEQKPNATTKTVDLSEQRRRADELRAEAAKLSQENAEAAMREINDVCRRRGVAIVPHVIIDAGTVKVASWAVIES